MFRNYERDNNDKIRHNYKKMRTNHTYDFNRYLRQKYLKFDKAIPLWDALWMLNDFVDDSDPDLKGVPNIQHAFQTAEKLRIDDAPDWLQFTGLIHDLGKIIFKWGCDVDGTSIKEQWSIVGDTFITGCKIPDTCVYSEYNSLNPDMSNERYNTLNGVYTSHCGLDNTIVSFGHDEYLYNVMLFNNVKLPDEALYIIRFHSLYPHHTGGSYNHLMNDKDNNMLYWLNRFNKYDLYTKSYELLDIESLMPYYKNLAKKFINNNEHILYF